ncbi:MAG: hypothetical protein ACYDBQ_08115 [Thermoplasmatota archaeon]
MVGKIKSAMVLDNLNSRTVFGEGLAASDSTDPVTPEARTLA